MSIELITNPVAREDQTRGDLHKSRREIEVFFRDIKQLLPIKAFIFTSKNEELSQIWTALITILRLKEMRATAKFIKYLSNLVANIRLNIFVKIELEKWLDSPFAETHKLPLKTVQRDLFPDFN